MKAHYRLIKGNRCSFLQASADERFIRCSGKVEEKAAAAHSIKEPCRIHLLFRQLLGFVLRSYAVLIGMPFHSQEENSSAAAQQRFIALGYC